MRLNGYFIIFNALLLPPLFSLVFIPGKSTATVMPWFWEYNKIPFFSTSFFHALPVYIVASKQWKESPSNNNNKFAIVHKTLSAAKMIKEMKKRILNPVENFVYGSAVASFCLTKDRKLSQSKQLLLLWVWNKCII